jgi:hypothetical protein
MLNHEGAAEMSRKLFINNGLADRGILLRLGFTDVVVNDCQCPAGGHLSAYHDNPYYDVSVDLHGKALEILNEQDPEALYGRLATLIVTAELGS